MRKGRRSCANFISGLEEARSQPSFSDVQPAACMSLSDLHDWPCMPVRMPFYSDSHHLKYLEIRGFTCTFQICIILWVKEGDVLQQGCQCKQMPKNIS